MRNWFKGHFGRSVAVGALSVALVGGGAYLVAGPLLGSAVSASGAPAAATVQGTTTATAEQLACVGGSSSTASGSAGAKASACTSGKRAGILRRLLARSDHASLEVRTKGGWVTVTLDRGTIQSISSSALTILRPDGTTVTAPISSSTKFLRATEASLAAGDHVAILQEGGTTRDVLAIRKGAKAGGSPSSGAGSKSATSSATT